jgi:hypothetical protein
MERTETKQAGSSDLGLDHTLAREAAEPAGPAGAAIATGNARYTLGRELGRGGMGRVVEAVDTQFNRVVAVKQVHADRATAPLLRRFATEALVTGNLEHPGIPAVYERGLDLDGRPFYAMRRAQGRTLAKLLAEADTRERRLALLPVVTRVAQTIGFAHDRGVVHRDIKPDNIIVGDHGETFVLDWGLARVRGVPVEDSGASSGQHDGTQYGAVVGTPAYMAPEQAAGDLDRVDERTDVFALGALLYHVITGAQLYRADTVDKLVEAAKAARPAAIADPALPRELVAICERAIARDPAARYRNAHELAAALERFSAHAVLGRPSRAVHLAFDVLLATFVAATIIGTWALAKQVSSFHQQGSAAYGVVALAICGALVSAVEWRTHGRYKLSAVAFAFMLATFFVGVASVASGLGHVFLGARELADDPRKYKWVVGDGVYEAVGGVAMAAQLAIVQLALWAVARRRVERAAERGAIV